MVENSTITQAYMLSLIGYTIYTERDPDMTDAFFESLKYPEREAEIYESYGITELYKPLAIRDSISGLFYSKYTSEHYTEFGFSAILWHKYFLESSQHRRAYTVGVYGDSINDEFLGFVESKLNDQKTKKIERYANMIWKCSQKKM